MTTSTVISYPLVEAAISGLRWLRVTVSKVFPQDVTLFPCRCFVTAPTTGSLRIRFGEEISNCFLDVPVSGSGFTTVSNEWARADVQTTEEPLVLNSTALSNELEPCCVLWLMTPLVEAASQPGWKPIDIAVEGGLVISSDGSTLTLPYPPTDEERVAEEAGSSEGLYMINGLSSESIDVRGSSSVVIVPSNKTLSVEKARRNG